MNFSVSDYYTPELLQTVLDHSLTNIYAANAVRHPSTGELTDFQIYFANPAFIRRVQQSDDDLQTYTLLALFPTLIETGYFERYRQVVETGEPFEGEQEYPGPNGHYWYQTSVKKLGDGIVVNFVDITRQHELVRRNQEQAQQLQAMLDASISSILAMTALREEDADGRPGQIVDFRIDKANQAVERSLGLPPEVMEGRNLLDLFPDDGERLFFSLYSQVVQTGQAQQATLPYSDTRGIEGWYEVSAVRQAPDRIVVTFLNVTASKQLEQQLRQSNASLDQFATVASHDLQEPLRKIKTFGDMLITQHAQNLGTSVDMLMKMQSAADRMQALILDLLAYARLAHNGESNLPLVDLNRILGDVFTDLEAVIEETHAVVEIETLPHLPGDALQLRQAFQNLLSNALKFTQPGQPPRVRVTCRPLHRDELPAEVSLPGLPGQVYWQITVADQGIGFNETYRDKIFNAFERLHSRQSSYSGTGIGLAIVKRVVENHRGAIRANSRPGEGATFQLYLPGPDKS